jgi:hypothetical protein
MSTGRTWFARFWPAALCALTVLLMYRDWLSDPYNPSLEGRARYGHNHEGALWQMVLWVLCEWAVLQGVLRPGGREREVWRAALALLLLLPWTYFSMFMAMHAGGIVGLHVLWLMAAVVGVAGVLVSRSVFRWRGASRLEAPP